MKIARLSYLNHHIQIELPNPGDGNTIYVEIHRQMGSYDPNEYNPYLTDYQFSAESDDPNDWVLEGVKSAIASLSSYGVRFHEPPPASPTVGLDESSDELDEIPF